MRLNKILCAALFVLGIVAIQAVQTFQFHSTDSVVQSESSLIPRSLLFGNPEKAFPSLSSTGTKLAYLAPDKNNVLNVYVKDLSKESADKQVTTDTTRGIRTYMWTGEDSILYLQDKGGDENWHIFKTDLSTGITEDLTPFEGITADIVDYNPHFPDQILIQMNRRDPSLHDVYRLNLKSGELLLDTENSGQVIEWITDNHLCVRASAAMDSQGNTLISVRENTTAPWNQILKIDPSELDTSVAGFTEDGNSLYCLTSIDSDTVRLIKWEIESGKYTVVAENPNYDLSSVQINPLTYRLEAVGYEGEKYKTLILDPEIAADFEWLEKQTSLSDGSIYLVSRDLKNRTWIIGVMSDIRSTSYYLFRREDKSLKFLFSPKPELENHALSSMKPISFTARDGMKIYGYLTLPARKDPKNLPLVLDVHGGPWARDSWKYNPEVQWLADRGYAVLQINFRGSKGYGKRYLNAGNREWGRKMHFDLLDGKQWAIDAGIADPEKVAIYGGSYGGYATLAALAFTPEEFCCGVDIVGPSNLLTLMQTLPAYWTPMKAWMDLHVGCIDTEPDFLRECSPLFKADRIKRPLLIAQGANDPRVKQAESDQIVEAMRKNHLPVTYLLFKDEGHGFAVPQNRMKFYAAAEEFLSRHLGGSVEPAKPEESSESIAR